MKRRAFSLSVASAAAACLTLPAFAQPARFQEGKDYKKIGKPVASDVPAGKVEVIEFFSYACPHCYHFEPAFEAWVPAAPKNLLIHRIPVNFVAPFYEVLQKLYFTLEGMNKLPELHGKVFHTMHEEHKMLNSDAVIFDWIGKQGGVDVGKFKEIYNSFTVANQVRKATQLTQDYEVEGVPALGVAGRYTINDAAGGLPTVAYLANMVLKG
jgi:thiol:disulfide interchange protein DsbA